MKTAAVGLVTSLFLALACGGIAHARTPSPTSTPTATSTLAPTSTPPPTPCPTVTPTLAPDQVSQFSGELWLYVPGPYPPGAVTARIGDTVCSIPAYVPPLCGVPPYVSPPSDPGPITADYSIDVVSESVKPGCGYEGAPVTFYVGDKPASRTAVWRAGSSQEIEIASQPPFAFFYGKFTLAFHLSEEIGEDWPAGMIALIGNEACGRALRGIWISRDPRTGGVYDYWAQVYSNEWQQGCGVDGDRVAFELIWNTSGTGTVSDGEVVGVARERGVWHAWGDGNTGIELNLTFAPPNATTLASVGDGSSPQRTRPLGSAPTAFAVAGLLLIVTTVVIQRKRLRAR